ncbi:MAG TPA: aldo/keto reductase [Solirubrobacteraceae bacterium]|nr:aldo/keto reductase [Solirubrobacteraceae bacterium]
MQTRRLGRIGPEASAVGLGCMGMSGMYGHADRAESIATIRAALDAGINVLDTGDFYGMGHNELLIAEALRGVPREEYLLSVKFGALRAPEGSWLGVDARPAAVKNSLAHSLTRLGVDHVDIYRPARVDPNVPIEETVGAIGEMVDAGYVRYVGLSEVGADTIRRATLAHPICDLQIEYSLISRGIEDAILPTCRELGIAITAYGVLSRGLISGHFSADRQLEPGDFRAHAPRFSEENRKRNLELVEELRAIANGIGASVAQVAIAWVLARGEDIVPLIGARTRERLAEALGALDVTLGDDDRAALEQAVPLEDVAGDRYPETQMAMLDSERT